MVVGQRSGWTLELLRKLQWVGVGDGVSMGDKEDDAQDSFPLWLAQMDGWCPALRWEPLGMTRTGQGREEWEIMSHSGFFLFSATVPCSILELPVRLPPVSH